MKIVTGFLILAAYAPYLAWANGCSGSPESIFEHRIVCQCPLIYKTVCGSDGVTYSNECIRRCVNEDHVNNGRPPVRLLHEGQCRPAPCNCPQVIKPVCGSNNQTYANDCYRGCDNARRAQVGLPLVALAYKGRCKVTYCRCPSSIIPVCGTDGKTYRNVCVLQCYSRYNRAQGLPEIYVKSSGACKKESCICPLVKNQLCASDGNTYHNRCTLDCQNRRRQQLGLDPLTVQYPGECINCICTANYNPVCASNGQTYSNGCVLACENKKRKRLGLPLLTVSWRGECGCGCTREWKPVCASNHKTWPNRCILRCQNRRRALNRLPPLAVLYDGVCKPCYCGYCSNQRSPVCGSNYQTYWNLCYLKCNSDCAVAAGQSPIKKIADKPC